MRITFKQSVPVVRVVDPSLQEPEEHLDELLAAGICLRRGHDRVPTQLVLKPEVSKGLG